MAGEPKASFSQGEYREAVEYFRQKVDLPTRTWRDLSWAMHSRAFAVAGAMRDDILSDFRQAVDKAIASGATLRDFRKDYNRIADKWAADDPGFAEKRTGKSYDAWRSKVIYSTNMATAYAAGREAQMHDPDMKDIWTHARYRCMMDGRERPEHAMWNDTVLPIDDPWWSTHTPPNGWNCRCWKEPVSATELKILKEEGVRVKEQRPTSPESTRGIDEGWNHNAGEAEAGNELLKQVYKQPKYFTEEQQGLWSGELEPLKLEAVNKKHLYPLKGPLESNQEFKMAMDKALGAENGFKQFEVKTRNFTYAYAVDTKYFTDHLRIDRSRFANMIAETIKDPQEIRAVFLKSPTGKVAVRHYFYSKFKDEFGNDKYVKVVFDANQARFASYTAMPQKNEFKAEGTVIYRKE